MEDAKKNKTDVNELDNEKKLSSQMEKQLSPARSILKIIIAILAFIWFLAGGSAQTVLSLSGGAIGLTGVVTFLIRNPISFLIIGIIQVVLGLIFYIFGSSFLLLTVFHFLWSIRWFYGYKKYRHLKNPNLVK
ncbi:MAG: hypothetical protein HZC47_01915 [Methanobacterium sp.]|uniref:hypothetical protein n=1 Tax=Methanobacterium sp. TaxID=2164 RepID=UPI003D653539|nr:hypothetical protein [Methanobacterium sp.]